MNNNKSSLNRVLVVSVICGFVVAFWQFGLAFTRSMDVLEKDLALVYFCVFIAGCVLGFRAGRLAVLPGLIIVGPTIALQVLLVTSVQQEPAIMERTIRSLLMFLGTGLVSAIPAYLFRLFRQTR